MTSTNVVSRRPFKPIFPAVITPSSIEYRTSTKNTPYIIMRGATVSYKDTVQTKTVMVFGQSISDVSAMLETGNPIRVAIQLDGATVRIVGQVRPRSSKAA